MKRYILILVISLFSTLIFTSCDSMLQKAGTFAVKFTWAKDGEGKDVKPDVSTGDFFVTVRIYEWKEGVAFPGDIAENGKQLIQSDPAQMKTTGTSIDFDDLTYGSRRFVVAEIRKGAELTGGILFTGMSQLFDFKAGKHTEVNVEMSMTGLPGYDENGENTFKIEVFYNNSPAERVPESLVAVRFTVRNADSVIIANDLNFEKGTAEIALTDLKKIDDTTYEYSPWDFTTGWEEIGDGTYTVFGKLKNNIGQVSEPKRADVFLDTTSPIPNITPFKEVAKPGDIVEVRFSFDEEVDAGALELDWQGLAFELAENKSDKSFAYTYTVKDADQEMTYPFYLTATDLVGNKTHMVSLGKVRIDQTAPDLNYIAMFKNESEHGLSSNLYLRHGDVLRFELEVNEEITEIPQLLLGTNEILCEEGEKDLVFDCSLTIDKDVTYDVVADITLSFKDVAGNIYSRSIVSGAKIDTQIPQFIFRKNKDPQDYNATDTIVLTITANEPVSIIEVDGTELDNTLTSWNITGINETGTFEVKLKAVDLAGNEQTEFTVGTYTVDAEYPEAVISGPTPARISGSGSSTISVTEAKKPIQSIKLNGVECNGAYCTFNAPSGSGDSVETLTVTLTDFAGNVSNLNAGTVNVDRTKPDIAGDATVIFTKPEGCPLSSVSSITSGSSVDISFIVNEPLKEIGDPLVSAEGEVNIIDFNMTGQIGYFYTFSKETINTEFLMDGTYVFKIEIEDEVGNKNNITLPGGFEIDTAKPDAPFVDEEERIVYRRIPWGSDATSGVKYFSIKATGDAVDENTAWVYAYDGSDPSTASEIGKAPVTNKTFNEFELNRSDRTEIYIAAYDTACNRSDAVKVRDVEWVATMGGKVPGSTWENPHSFYETHLFSDTLNSTGYGDISAEKTTAMDSLPLITEGAGTWKLRTFEIPIEREGQSMTYFSNTGKTVMFGGYFYDGTVSEYLNETWEWDGVQWEKRTGSSCESEKCRICSSFSCPSARSFHSIAYDSIRNRMILFGGADDGDNLEDLWEWDGDKWIKIVPKDPENDGNPSARSYHSFVFDPHRNVFTLFGGWIGGYYYDDLWEWNGKSWKKIIPTDPEEDGNPSPRRGHSMVYDSFRRRTVLFGGSGEAEHLNDTWEWDGVSWKKLLPDASPSAYFGHSMAYDPLRNRMVLFGGFTDSGSTNDLWEWDGTDWEKITPITAEIPAERSWHSMVFDVKSEKIILFGGYYWTGSDSIYFNDVWEWDGSAWKIKSYGNMIDPGDPLKRSGHAMAYDPGRMRTVMYGGTADGFITNDSLWEWDGILWQEIVPADPENDGNPPLRQGIKLVYDIENEETLMLVKKSYYVGTLWSWNGESWAEKILNNPSVRPPDLRGYVADYDPINKKTVIYGGLYGDMDISNSVWEWDGLEWLEKPPVDPENEEIPWVDSMVYFPVNDKFISLGQDSETENTQTWEWNGTNWIKILPADPENDGNPPYSSSGHSMVYDASREKLLMFGGSDNNYTWEWNGNSWIRKTVADPEEDGSPAARSRHDMVYDSVLEKVIMYGGNVDTSIDDDKTWEWDGGSKKKPGHLIKVIFPSSNETPESVVLQSVSASFNSGGIGYAGENCNSVNGAKMMVWDTALKSGSWRKVAENTASFNEVDKLEFTINTPDLINHFFAGDEMSINIAVIPISQNGCSNDMGSIATDYAEVVVKYRIKDN